MAVPPDRGAVRRRFLILHGWQNRRPKGHWQFELAAALTQRGHEVSYPPLPNPDLPDLKKWVGAIDAELMSEPGVEQVVIAHSLACIAWIHLPGMTSGLHLPVDRLLFVAPPSPGFLAETPELRDFQYAEGAQRLVAETSRTMPRLACAEGDPYCDPPAYENYDVGFDVDVVAGAGHFDTVADYGEWDSVLRWCEDPKVRLTPR